jgi:murein DD-endopeptidase MepM/ murein hydrolase activator NlpD
MNYYSATNTTRRSESQSGSKMNKDSTSFLSFIGEYFQIRSRQITISSGLLSELISQSIVELKSLLVRNMYWGRTSFYKSAFHVLVVLITVSALYAGLGNRITTVRKESLANVSVSAGYVFDSDLIYQQGSLFSIDEYNESDSLYSNYTVKEGDSLNGIAEEQDISEDTLRWANEIPSGRDTLKVGQVIRIPKTNGVLYTTEDGDTVDEVISKVELENSQTDKLTFLELNSRYINEDETLIPGSQVLIPDATLKPPPKPTPTPQPRRTNNRPAQTVVESGGGVSVPSGTFVNPMQNSGGYRYSRGYSYGHTGVDLAAPSGSWISAAGAGTVLRAGWCFSLGYCVQIAHAGGFQTVYGHGNGVFAVSAGQTVAAGQRIMQVGCTGICYGSHLHLSLTRNNQDVLNCYRCRINPRGIIPY